jgi:hypothetical protein
MTATTTRKFIKPDKHGNVLTAIFQIEGKETQAIIVRIRVRGENRERTVGVYEVADKIFHVKRDSEKHFHRMSQSYGFNWEILNDSMFKEVQNIHLLVDGSRNYLIPIAAIRQHGRALMFKQQGFELQLFVPLSVIEQYSVTVKQKQ